MRVLIGIVSVLLVTSLLAYAGLMTYNRQAAIQAEAKARAVAEEALRDPRRHEAGDVEYAKMLILYHEFATQLDDYAKENASRAEVRKLAVEMKDYNVRQANAYAGMLDLWGVTYERLVDFPKSPTGGCVFPTFPGILPHQEISAFLQTSGEEVDKQYLALTKRHHEGTSYFTQHEKDSLTNGGLMTMRDEFFATISLDVKDLEARQRLYGFN